MANVDDIKSFLVQLQSDVELERATVSRRRDGKTSDLLRQFGWTRKIMFNYLLDHLIYSDYISGPKPDHNKSKGEIWVFGKTIESIDTYIKIKIHPNGAKCLSFHEKERPFRFPFKGGDMQ